MLQDGRPLATDLEAAMGTLGVGRVLGFGCVGCVLGLGAFLERISGVFEFGHASRLVFSAQVNGSHYDIPRNCCSCRE
jgi:hypothetical protein